MIHTALQSFFNSMRSEYGDVPIRIVLPDNVHSQILYEVESNRRFVTTEYTHCREERVLSYAYGNRIVELLPETRIEDYIERVTTRIYENKVDICL